MINADYGSGVGGVRGTMGAFVRTMATVVRVPHESEE